jgi:hypothetical protein
MAKPESPLTELAAPWCPIFAEPERDYDYLTAIRSFCRSGSGGRFKLATDDRTPVGWQNAIRIWTVDGMRHMDQP